MTLVDIFKLIASAFTSPPLFRKPDLPAKIIDLGTQEPFFDKPFKMQEVEKID
jgi:hypothetical protein